MHSNSSLIGTAGVPNFGQRKQRSLRQLVVLL